MSLVPSFLDLLQPLSCVMTCPTFGSFVTLLTGWAFARRRTITGMLLAAGAVGVGSKHHSAYHRVFALVRGDGLQWDTVSSRTRAPPPPAPNM